MASDNIEDWDQPLPTPSEKSEDTEDGLTSDELRYNTNLNRLKNYVELMSYKPVAPVKASKHTESLSQPKRRTLIDNSKQFSTLMSSPERGDRLTRLAAKHETITIE